jgi:hypothetical protein
MPDDPAYLVVTTLVCLLPILHARLRVRLASGIPHTLSGAHLCAPEVGLAQSLEVALAQSSGREYQHNSGAACRGNAEVRVRPIQGVIPRCAIAHLRMRVFAQARNEKGAS